MNRELKPCPFCGGEAYIRLQPYKQIHIDCRHSKKCVMQPDTWLISDMPIKKQINAWNRRVDDE